jgi:bacillolysin
MRISFRGLIGLLLLSSAIQAGASSVRDVRLNPLATAPATPIVVTDAPQSEGATGSLVKDRLLTVLQQTKRGAISGSNSVVSIRPRLGKDVEITYRSNGTPLQIKGARLQAPVRATTVLSVGMDDEVATAREFLRQNRQLLRLQDPDTEMRFERREADDLGRTHIRFIQEYKSLPVWPSDLIVHLDSKGAVDLMDGAYVPTPRRLIIEALVDSAGAVTRAQAAVAAKSSTVTPPELIVYAPAEGRPRLAWKMTVSVSALSRWVVVIDALNGVTLTKYNEIMNDRVTGSGRDTTGALRTLNLWREGGTYYLVDGSKKMFDTSSTPPGPSSTRGAIFIGDASHQPTVPFEDPPPPFQVMNSSNPNAWNIPETVGAAYLISETYDYYLDRHNRNSIDGKAGSIFGIVRYGTDVHNAFFDSSLQQLFFGDGDTYSASLDTVAHEMTHGVTNHSANLVYQGQSGALNEAISDIFGEFAEARTFGSADWMHGTGKQFNRSLISPNQYQQPAKMSEFVQTSEDNGGVHTNSGIINHAGYLLAAGMANSIGIRDSERVFYQALTQHLTKNSQFVDARAATITSAEEVFGVGSNQARAAADAFDGVEIFGAAPATPPPTIPKVNAADATLFVFRDANGYFLGRRELSADGADGARLSSGTISPSRPSVSGDGSIAIYVDDTKDVCVIRTDGTLKETCLGFPAQGVLVSSIAMSPDSNKFGLVLFKDSTHLDNKILVVDIAKNTTTEYRLVAPAYDGTTLATVAFADAMVFTSDGRFLLYDAFNVIQAQGTAIGVWSIYALDLVGKQTLTILPPLPGLDIDFPALGHTNDDLMAFEIYDPSSGMVTVAAGNLLTGQLAAVGTERGIDSVPSYTGDDNGIVFAGPAATPTGSSLILQRLVTADHVQPSGPPTTWLNDGGYASMYRRGTYGGPTTNPGSAAFSSSSFNGNKGSVVTIGVGRAGGNKGAVSVSYATSNGTATAGTDYTATSGTLSWADGESGTKTFKVALAAGSGNKPTQTINLRLSSAAGGLTISSAAATLNVIDKGSTTTPKTRHRGARH